MLLPRLYTYFRSGSSHRVRIALALKGIPHESIPVHLLRDGGEHRRPEYRAITPQARLPSLALHGGNVLIQPPAILEYLEDVAPEPPLLPADSDPAGVFRSPVRCESGCVSAHRARGCAGAGASRLYHCRPGEPARQRVRFSRAAHHEDQARSSCAVAG